MELDGYYKKGNIYALITGNTAGCYIGYTTDRNYISIRVSEANKWTEITKEEYEEKMKENNK